MLRSLVALPVVLARLKRASDPHKHLLGALHLHSLAPLSVVLARLRHAAHPHNQVVSALHEAAAATRAAALAAHQAAIIAAHPAADPLAFYEIAAAIIPLLYLVVVYQSGAWEPRSWRRELSGRIACSTLWTAELAVLLAVIGEATALNVLASGHGSLSDQRVVASALVITGALVVQRPLTVPGSAVDFRDRLTRSTSAWAILLTIGILSTAALVRVWS